MNDELQALVDGINTGLTEKFNSFNTTIDARLAEMEGKITTKVEDPEPKVEVEEDAELEKGKAMDQVTGMKVWDIPVGQALVGGFSAVCVSELVDGFLRNQQSMTLGIVKLVGAGALAKWGKRLLGDTGSKAAAIILAYDGMRQIIPIDEWANRLVGGVTTLTGGGLAGKAGMTNVRTVATGSNYYAGLKV